MVQWVWWVKSKGSHGYLDMIVNKARSSYRCSIISRILKATEPRMAWDRRFGRLADRVMSAGKISLHIDSTQAHDVLIHLNLNLLLRSYFLDFKFYRILAFVNPLRPSWAGFFFKASF